MTEPTTNQAPQPQAPQPETQPIFQQVPQQQPQQQAAAPQQPVAPEGFVPPAGQVPPYQPYGMSGAPVPPSVQPMPGMPLMQLTGGMKAGWFFVGFLLGPVGILLAWLINLTNFPEVKSGALKFSLIGCAVTIVLAILLGVFVGMATFAAMSSLLYYY